MQPNDDNAMNDRMQQPSAHGLYDPSFEHDACGVGLTCDLSNEPSHAIVDDGLRILENLEHRGACGCDGTTGDGAGIMMQMPDAFLRARCEELGIDLPARGTYGVGMVFLPPDRAQREHCEEIFEEVVHDEGQQVLGWRDVPVQSDVLGAAAADREPVIRQVFIERSADVQSQDAFERRLFVTRKRIEHLIADSSLSEKDKFHIPSLSAVTLVYKGMLIPQQIRGYFPDLSDEKMESALALVHARFSTNTFPQWSLAQPFHRLCHNGEINTLRGNINRMRAREVGIESDVLGEDLDKIHPILDEEGSDSHIVDSTVELLCYSGRSLPHVMMMLVPEAWERHEEMDEAKRGFYQYHACLMEPWDGPAKLAFTDGRYLGAVLDRNGLRPSRYTVTKDGRVFMASETGVVDVAPENVREKGRIQPGRMFLVDLEEGRLVSDEEVKERLSTQQPYEEWVQSNLLTGSDLPAAEAAPALPETETLRRQQQLFGYTMEDVEMLMLPMAEQGKEPIGSMGDDTPLAVLSERPRLLYDYFKQHFAQVTNPPLDAIREALVTSLYTYLGAERNLLTETPKHAHRLRLEHPILTEQQLGSLHRLEEQDAAFRTYTLDTCFDRSAADGEGLAKAMTQLYEEAAQAVDDGYRLLVLSDREADRDRLPIPALLALSGVHHHLIREGKRTRCSLIVESGEPREVHHFCTLLGFGADAVNPYLALDSIRQLVQVGEVKTDEKTAIKHYIKALQKGILKVMSKMGISTLQGYQGAQIFEAVGLSDELIDTYFTHTASRIGGIGLDEVARATRHRHAYAFPQKADLPDTKHLDPGGRYQWRRGGEDHNLNPLTIAKLQQATRRDEPDEASYAEYSELINQKNRDNGTLRGLLRFDVDEARSVPLDEVEPWTEIVKRFKTGAMSYGSISIETHETIAVAMNAIGGKSNTGEGGEHPERYARKNNSRSRIKQVASGRFGVTIGYLTSADEIQIKMAQGAKPGEGGQLPGQKVYPWIADVRQSTPGVALISPPPHHDIYSIEDLAQLIFDLKNSNPEARVTVKLVSEAGVGTIAAGVAKGKADVVLISGHSGGTGASPQTSIMHAGLPWELGLAETHQTLISQGLRNRIAIECDGQLRTGRDVAVAALLGAEEFGFSTAPLVTLGCIMMRKCHLNTCPVGIATQDPELRKKFTGKPKYVINFFYLVAQELRKIMARLGFRTLDEMVGRTDRLQMRDDIEDPESRLLDLAPLLYRPEVPDVLKPFAAQQEQHHEIQHILDRRLIELAQPALEDRTPVEEDVQILNRNRTTGTMLSSEISKRYGADELPDDTIVFNCTGSAGQSFAAFGAPGLTFRIRGDANDYFGKGLSGARLILQPPKGAGFVPEDNIIAGNVALYGATGGQVFIRGQAGERFGVRNSGAEAVVEGVGDHGCEYMTGGRVVVLGETGRNFAAGMSGGVAYVLDRTGAFAEKRCNTDMVDLERLEPGSKEAEEVRALIEQHGQETGSTVARDILDSWDDTLPQFVKIMPIQYKKALERIEAGEIEAVGDGALHEHLVEIEDIELDADTEMDLVG